MSFGDFLTRFLISYCFHLISSEIIHKPELTQFWINGSNLPRLCSIESLVIFLKLVFLTSLYYCYLHLSSLYSVTSDIHLWNCCRIYLPSVLLLILFFAIWSCIWWSWTSLDNLCSQFITSKDYMTKILLSSIHRIFLGPCYWWCLICATSKPI